MTIDVASLVFEIDSSQALLARERLEALEKAGAGVDASARRTQTATERANVAHRDAIAQLNKLLGTTGSYERALGELAVQQGTLERATRRAAVASVELRAQRALESAAMREMVQAAKQYEREQAQLAARAQALKASVDPLGASLDRVNKELQEAATLYGRGAISTADYEHAQSILAARMTVLQAAHSKAGSAAKLQSYELVNLGRQLGDVGTMAAMGASPMSILATQGFQVAEIFGVARARGVSFGAALKDLGGLALTILGKAGPFAIGAVAVGGLAAAFIKGSKEAATFRNSLAITRNYAGLTADAYQDMAERIADANDVSIRSSKAAISQLVLSGKYSAETIEEMVSAAQKFAKFTGQNASDVVDDFAKMKGGVAAWAAQHALSYHDLTLAQIDYIDKLEKQGKHEEAVRTTMKYVNDGVKELTPSYGFLEQAIHGVTRAASDMWDALLGVGRGKTLGDQLAEARSALQSAASPYNLGVQAGSHGQGAAAAASSQQRYLELRVGVLDMLVTGEQKAAADAAKKAQEEADKIEKKYGSGRSKASTPRDTTAERTAQIEQLLAQAKADELRAQLALTDDLGKRSKFERELLAAESAAKQAQIDRQIANVADDKGLTAAKKAEITGQLEAVKATQMRVAALQQQALDQQNAREAARRDLDQREALLGYQGQLAAAQADMAGSATERAKIEQDALSAQQAFDADRLAKETELQVVRGEITEAYRDQLISAQKVAQGAQAELAARQASWNAIHERAAIEAGILGVQADLANGQADVAKFASERAALDQKILGLQHQIERIKIQEVIDTTAAGTAAHQIAVAQMAIRDEVERYAREGLRLRILASTTADAARAIEDIGDAVRNHDWGRAFTSLINAVDQAVTAFATAKTAAERMSATGSLFSAAGGAVGGTAGNVLGAVGSGFSAAGAAAGMAGSFGALGGAIAGLAGPIGIAVGGLSLLSGILGDQKAKKRAKLEAEARDIENARAIALERANKRAELELRILELSGDEVGALTRRREAELKALDSANRALQEHIYALEDWAKAVSAAKDAVSRAEDDLRDAYEAERDRLQAIIGGVDAARDVLRDAYQRERSAIESTISSVRSLVDTLSDFRAELDMASNSPGLQYRTAWQQFSAAAPEDIAATGRSFVDVSRSTSATDLDFQRDLAAVRRKTDEASATAKTQLTNAERQLVALESLVSPLLAVNDNLISVEEAVSRLATAEQAAAMASAEMARLDAQVGALITINSSVLSVAQAVANLEGAIGALARAEASKPTGGATSASYEAVGFAGYVDRNSDLAALYASGSGMAAGRTKEEFGAYHWERYGQGEDRFYRPFARGGDHMGGLRLVGEEGPELEATGPSRIFSARQTQEMLRGDNSRLEALVEGLTKEVASLRKERAEDARQIKRNTKDTADIMAKVTQGKDSLRTTDVAA